MEILLLITAVLREDYLPKAFNFRRHSVYLYLCVVIAFAISVLFLPSRGYAQAGDEASLPSIPDYFQQRGLPEANSTESQSANELINNFTGKLHYSFTDLVIPGNGGMDLVVKRSYTSVDDPLGSHVQLNEDEYSPVGHGWTMHMGRVIRGESKFICSTSWYSAAANPVLELPDGSRQILYEDSMTPQGWITKDFWRAKCVGGINGVGGFLHVQSPNGTTYEMTASGHTFGPPGNRQKAYYAGRIVDRNGNWFEIDYQFLPNGIMAMSQITTNDGREVSFSYAGSALASMSNIIDSVNNAANPVWQYTVASGVAGRVYLTNVERPDGTSWKHAYHSASPGIGSMSRIEYPSGGSINYTYGLVDFKVGTPRTANSTVVVSKTAATNYPNTLEMPSLSGTWTWAYQVATNPLPSTIEDGITWYSYSVPPDDSSQVNVTTVTDPSGQYREYYHFGIHSMPTAPTKVGLAIGNASSQEITTLGYQNIVISEQQDVVANMFHPGYYYPAAELVNSQTINRAGERFTTTRSGFDNWGNPSTINEVGTNQTDRTYSRQTNLTYSINSSKWLLRQVASEMVTVNGQTHATTRQFDPNGNILSQTVAGVPTSFTYHPSGDVASSTNANSQTTSMSNYFRGTPLTESQPEGVTITRTVNAAGDLTAETNGRGKTSSYSYDQLGRLVVITPAEGSDIAIVWTPTSRQVERGSMRDTTTFDGLGRVISREVSAPGLTPVGIKMRYDMLGQKTFQSYPNSTLGTGFRYDPLGRVTTTLHGHTAGTTTASSIEYTGFGDLRVTRQDTSGRGSIDLFRSFGNPGESQIIQALSGEVANGQLYVGANINFSRDVLGQPLTVTMGGKTRSYEYDSRYMLVSRTDPEIGTTFFGRDAIGNLISQAIGTGPETLYSYDDRNRVVEISYPVSEDSSVPAAPVVSHTYNANDLLESVNNGLVVQTYSYDDGDKLVEEAISINGSTQTVEYAYNANEALSEITYPSGNKVNYHPDAFGRATAVAPYVTSVTYHANGIPSEVIYANGVRSSMGINARQWPSTLEYTHSLTPFVDSVYGYDQLGNMTQINDYIDSVYSRGYEYDKLGRLTAEGAVDGWRDYYYDATGNLTNVVGPTFSNSYTYNAVSGLLVGVSGGLSRIYQYDSAGNVLSDGNWAFGYDRANNLRCTNCSSTIPVQHTYDGTGMRVLSVEGSSTTEFLHNHQGMLLQTLKPGLERKEHIYLGRRQVAERSIPLN